MARQIDLDQLMKYPLRRGSEHCDEKNADPRFLNGVESILEWAQTLPTLTPPNEWVSVEERLPKAEKEDINTSAKVFMSHLGCFGMIPITLGIGNVAMSMTRIQMTTL